MKPIHFVFFLMLYLLIGIISCSKDDKNVIPGTDKEVVIEGFITDDNGLYISGAVIEFGSVNTSSNIDGYFQLPASKYNDEVFIKVNKPGYFTGSRTLFLEKSTSAHVRISLLPKTFSKSFLSNSNAAIDGGKVKLVFPANAIVDEQGNLFTGQVKVAMKYLDPSDFSIRNVMPGDLVGLNTSGEMQQLGSYGMAAVELQSNTGAKLNVKAKTEVMLKIEIPQSMLANAPATIPLWYFDEVKGLWKEQGTATKNGNVYEGTVTHFSFWNCDISWPLVHLTGRIVHVADNGVINSNVKLTIVRTGMSAYDRTNNEGVFEGMVPKNENLLLEILSECNHVIYSTNIGPFSSDTDLGEIQINSNSPFLLNIRGTIVDCNNQPHSDAIVLIKSNSLSYTLPANTNGEYSGILTLCTGDPVTITAYSITTLKQSVTVTYNLPGPINVTPLQVCNDSISPDEYISVIVSDGSKNLFIKGWLLDLYLNQGSHNIIYQIDTADVLFDISALNLPYESKESPIEGVTYLIYDTLYHNQNIIPNNNGNVYYSRVANIIGEYYEGTFHAVKITKINFNTGEEYGNNFTLSGAFRIKRKT
jgi:hypothetical protein